MRQRSSYPKPFKAQVVQECLQPGATLSALAFYRDQSPAALPAFVPLRATPKRQAEALAIIELLLGKQSIEVKWSVSDPDGCARFVRGLTL